MTLPALRALREAFGYFSLLPAGRVERAPGPGALEALPLVGGVCGLLAGGVAGALGRVLPASFAAPIVLSLRIALTGAIHLDGFLDACDGLFASVPPERRREILHDPRHGTYALAGLAVVVPLELAAVASLPPRRRTAALAAAATIARAAVVAAVRPGADGDAGRPAFARAARPLPVIVAMLAGSVLASRSARHGWCVPLAALPLAAGLVRFARLRLGVVTGDAAGFAIVVVETGVLVTLGALAERSA